MKQFIAGLLSWVLMSGFTPYAEGKRVYIGKNRVTDWIDVGCLYTEDANGFCCQACWCDESPIESVKLSTNLGPHYASYQIKKAYSTWSLIYYSPAPEDVQMTFDAPFEVYRGCYPYAYLGSKPRCGQEAQP